MKCDCEHDELETMEVRMSVSSLGDGSSAIGVNIPKSMEKRIMNLCSRDDTYRSQVIRAALMFGLPILESIQGLSEVVDPGGKDCPLDT